MPIGELSSIVQTLLTWLISKWEFIASGVAVTALILWICARTGSTHVLNKRLWRLVLGKHEIKSPALSAFAEQRDDLMHFRTLTSLKRVPTAVAAERLVDWLKRFDIDVDLVAAAGEHFDLEEPGFTRPPPRPRAMLVMMLGAVILFYGALTAGLFGALTPPVIQVKSSQIWYAVTNDRATKFHLGGDPAPVIESANCGNATAIAKTTLYPSHDVEVLCELMSSDKGKSKLHGAQMSQMLLAAIATPLLLFAGMRLFRSLRRADKANKLYKLVNQRRSAQDPKPEAVETSAQGAGAGDDAAKGPSGP